MPVYDLSTIYFILPPQDKIQFTDNGQIGIWPTHQER